MWTAQNRRRYDRSQLRYPSDLTDDEWAHVGPLIPPARRGGNKRHVDVREVMNGIMYILSTGCQWRAIPTTQVAVSEPNIAGKCCLGGARRAVPYALLTPKSGARVIGH